MNHPLISVDDGRSEHVAACGKDMRGDAVARTATVRSASLAPKEAQLADDLAEAITGGSFSQLTQLLLNAVGQPLLHRIEELRASGLEPGEHLFIARPTPADTDEQAQRFYAPSSWPAQGPRSA